MKNISLFLMIISATFFNVAHAEEKWVKDQNGCNIWWAHSQYGMFKAVNWSGQCKKGYASGHGVARYQTIDLKQDVFRGRIKKGKLNGYGKYRWSNGGTYAGMLKNSKMHGQGTRTWPNGDRYTGSWRKSQKHGKGKVIWGKPCSSCYQSFVGHFHRNKFKTGTYTLANGKKINKRKPQSDSIKKHTDTYLSLMAGYMTNRHLHYGN